MKTLNISPEKLTYQIAGKQKIVLGNADRLDLQKYVLQGMTLPASADAVKAAFGIPDSKIPDFTDIITAYAGIRDHCKTFYDGAFTGSVNLASNIIEFNFSAKYYLTGIARIAADFEAGKISGKDAQEQCAALVDILIKNIGGYVEACDKVCAGIKVFLEETLADNVTMNGQDGKSGLNKKYYDKYHLNESDIKQLNDDIAEAQRELDKASADYNYDVTVAATTPTYAWIFPFGTIPAVVVAGVYGKRAADAYKKMGECRDRIKAAQGDLQAKMAMVGCLRSATDSVSHIADLIQKAVAPIEAMKGCWNAIFDDLGSLKKTIQEDIADLPVVVKSIGVEKALAQWETVAQEADDYRKTAYISSTSKNLVEAGVIQFPAIKKTA